MMEEANRRAAATARRVIRLLAVLASVGGLAAVALATHGYAIGKARIVEAAAVGASRDHQFVKPTRPAQFVGAYAANWRSANHILGPMRSDKIFYPPWEPLPQRWPKNSYGLTRGTLAIVAYKYPTKNVLSFVRSIPRTREVAMVFWQEPEAHLTASRFMSEFKAQSRLIQSAHRSNVAVAFDAGTYRYQSWDSSAYNCGYVPPRRYVDYYFGDVYEANDQSLEHLPYFQRWVHCTAHRGRARGLAEYGLGNCQGSAFRARTILADTRYMRRHFPYLHVLSYWWSDTSPDAGTSCHNDWQFTDPTTISVWRSIESGARPSHVAHRRHRRHR
jgi:hypothetical protein